MPATSAKTPLMPYGNRVRIDDSNHCWQAPSFTVIALMAAAAAAQAWVLCAVQQSPGHGRLLPAA